MSNFMGVGIFWIGLNRADLGCWRLTLRHLARQTREKYFCLSFGYLMAYIFASKSANL